MRHLKISTHPKITSFENQSMFQRLATRAIAVKGENILMLYTQRYDDYSLPGGGVDSGEDFVEAMIRELQEETGAQEIQNIKEFGIYEEYRPWYKPDFDIVHMISYCYTCSVKDELGKTSFEHYEVSNGMKPIWVNIHEAISHNEKTIAHSEKKGMSIERETFLLRLIRKELI